MPSGLVNASPHTSRYTEHDSGRCGSLYLHRNGLAPSIPCRFPEYRAVMLEKKLSVSTVNVRVSAIRKLVDGGPATYNFRRAGHTGISDAIIENR